MSVKVFFDYEGVSSTSVQKAKNCQSICLSVSKCLVELVNLIRFEGEVTDGALYEK